MTGEKNFIWDEAKRAGNLKKHKLDFEIAEFVFDDPNARTIQDLRSDKNYGEDRFLTYGLVAGMRLCLCWTPREGIIRVISLFKVKPKIWRRRYEND
jgi:uncharacterized DUF497 family protein